MLKRLCIFCGSRSGIDPRFTEQAKRLGRAMAERDLGLVYGGGHVGLMGVLADAVLHHGGEAIGVIPQALVDHELAHAGVTTLHVVPNMHERKAKMAELSDAFAALPGAYGTADELFEVLTWAQLGLHSKPIGVLNVAGFFDPLLAWLARAVDDELLKPKHRELLIVATEPEDLLDRLLHAPKREFTEKWLEPRDL